MGVMVFEDLDLPGGVGAPPYVVEITLWGAGRPIVGKEVSTNQYIGGTYRPPIDSNGIWSAELVSNTDILPGGTTYRIVHNFGCDVYTTYISVPITGGPFDTQSIEVDAMNEVAPPILSIHASDLLLHGGGIELDYAELVTATVVTGGATGYGAVPGVVVTVPDVPRPVYLHGHSNLVQQSGGPTAGTLGLHPITAAPSYLAFFQLEGSIAQTMSTTVGPTLDVWARLPPHSGGDYVLTARGNSGNFTVVVNGSVLTKTFLRAIAA